MSTKKPKPKRSALSKHFAEIGKKGGSTTAKRHGKDHYRKAALKRWGK